MRAPLAGQAWGRECNGAGTPGQLPGGVDLRAADVSPAGITGWRHLCVALFGHDSDWIGLLVSDACGGKTFGTGGFVADHDRAGTESGLDLVAAWGAAGNAVDCRGKPDSFFGAPEKLARPEECVKLED